MDEQRLIIKSHIGPAVVHQGDLASVLWKSLQTFRDQEAIVGLSIYVIVYDKYCNNTFITTVVPLMGYCPNIFTQVSFSTSFEIGSF
jgi:hypothetical protein